LYPETIGDLTEMIEINVSCFLCSPHLEWATEETRTLISTIIVIDNSEVITFHGALNEEKVVCTLPWKPPQPTRRGTMIHRLAARAIIREIEEDPSISDENAKALIVPLAIKYSLASKYTSFMAEEDRSDPILETPELVTVPNEMPTRYGPSRDSILASLDETRMLMSENLSLLLDRSENLELLDYKSASLGVESRHFLKKASSFQKKSRKQMVAVICVVLLLVRYRRLR
jgi:hypothetical protein